MPLAPDLFVRQGRSGRSRDTHSGFCGVRSSVCLPDPGKGSEGKHKVSSLWAWGVIRSSQHAGRKGPCHSDPHPCGSRSLPGVATGCPDGFCSPGRQGRGHSGAGGQVGDQGQLCLRQPRPQDAPQPPARSPPSGPGDRSFPSPTWAITHSPEETTGGRRLWSPPASSVSIAAAGLGCLPASGCTLSSGGEGRG